LVEEELKKRKKVVDMSKNELVEENRWLRYPEFYEYVDYLNEKENRRKHWMQDKAFENYYVTI